MSDDFDYLKDIDPLLARIIREGNYKAINDPKEIRVVCEEVVASNPDKVTVYRKGKTNIIGFFIAEVMKKTNSGAEPEITNKILKEILDPGT